MNEQVVMAETEELDCSKNYAFALILNDCNIYSIWVAENKSEQI
jgi:hypothetical protein